MTAPQTQPETTPAALTKCECGHYEENHHAGRCLACVDVFRPTPNPRHEFTPRPPAAGETK